MTSTAEFLDRESLTSAVPLAAHVLAAAHRRIRQTLGRKFKYGPVFGWSCDSWVQWVETGEKGISPQVRSAAAGVATALAVVGAVGVVWELVSDARRRRSAQLAAGLSVE